MVSTIDVYNTYAGDKKDWGLFFWGKHNPTIRNNTVKKEHYSLLEQQALRLFIF